MLIACGGVQPKVKNGFIREANGGILLLRGVNVSQAHKRAPYFDDTTDYSFVRETLGMNSVRFLLQWQAIEPERGAYDLAYLDSMRTELMRATSAGLYVVLDMHQDLFGGGFQGGNGAPAWACDQAHYAAFRPRTPWLLGYTDEHVIACFDRFWSTHQDAFAEAWRQVARAVGKNERVIGADIINEPHWGSADAGTFEATVLTPFYDRVISAIREEQPGWLAFVEPSASRNLGIATSLRQLKAENVVYAPHLYDAAAETDQGFSPARRDALQATANALAEEAQQRGWALWIGEYGGQPAHTGITDYMDAVYDSVSAHRAGSAYWHLGRDAAYGIFDRTGEVKQTLLAAIVRPYPERVAGEPISITFDEVTRVFTLEQTSGAAGSTIISVPARVYPRGIHCEGCTVRDGRAIFAHSPARIVITPE